VLALGSFVSDSTRRVVDEEQQYITDLAHHRALALVSERERRPQSRCRSLARPPVAALHSLSSQSGD
jgi:hypothetical protein